MLRCMMMRAMMRCLIGRESRCRALTRPRIDRSPKQLLEMRTQQILGTLESSSQQSAARRGWTRIHYLFN